MSTNGMKVFVGTVFILILLPMVNTLLIKKDVAPLYGVSSEYTRPEFSLSSFQDGSYQKQYEAFCSRGFRGYNFTMRALNEMRFRLFDEAGNIVVCKDGSVIFEQYIDEYLGLSGTHYCSPEYLDRLAEQLSRISTLAESTGKELVVVVTPSKADFISEQIPDKYYYMNSVYAQEQRGSRQLVERMEEAGITYIDSVALLQSRDGEFPVFTETGIHWTRDAALQVIAALADCLKDRGYSLKQIEVTGREVSAIPQRGSLNNDDDLWLLMNLFSRKETTYIYPIEEEQIPLHYDMPAVFLQGGSYTFTLLEILADHDVIRDLNFLFYDIALYDYNEDRKDIAGLTDAAIFEKVRDSDIILLEVNEECVYNMGSGFLPVLEGLLSAQQYEPDNAQREFQVGFKGFGPWESANDISWRWAYGNNALLTFSNVPLDAGIYATFWVPYSGYLTQNSSCGKSVDIDVFVNGEFYKQYTCSEDSIFDVQVDKSKLTATGENIIEIRSPYTMRIDTQSGAKIVSVQVLAAGRTA